MTEEYIKHGTAAVNAAIQQEKNGEVEKAVENYIKGIDWFNMVIQYEKNIVLKERIKTKVLDYITRVEQLKKRGSALAEGASVSLSSSVIIKESPNVRWDDVIGLETAKQALQETVILPLRFPNVYKETEVTPWNGILLYGPPGTGKTQLAKAVATETKSTFFSVTTADLISKWVGESARLIKALFEEARKHKPSIIFVDEVDSICMDRSNNTEKSGDVQNEFITQMNGLGKDQTDILVLAATNIPWKLDKAIRRRFQIRVYIPLPDVNARALIFQKHLPETFVKQHVFKKFLSFAKKTEGYSGADIAVICNEAKFRNIRKIQEATHFIFKDEHYIPCSPGEVDSIPMTYLDIPENKAKAPALAPKDVLYSIEKIKPTVSHETLKEYEDWTKEFGIK